SRLAPTPDRVETPAAQPPDRRIAPDRQIVRPVFSLQIGGVEVESPPVVETAALLRRQAAAFVRTAVMHGERVTRLGQLGKHEPPSFDKSRSEIGADAVHPEREEAVALACDEPPSAVPVLGAKEPGRRKAR